MSSNVDLKAWNQTLAQVLSKNYNEEAIALLLKGIETLTRSSSGMVTLYPHAKPPHTSHHRLLANEDPSIQIDKYDSGAYLLDPFYRKAYDERAEGVFTMHDVAPIGFEKSEYYNIFYKQLGYCDEMCVLLQLEQQAIVSISLARHISERSFSKDDIEQLTIIFPLLKAIIVQWVQKQEQSSDYNLEWQLDNALVNFGQSILTPRECEILHLILHGYSIKVIAQKLENSLETIKHHRKNIYVKLDVSSQAELFYLFIASLKAMPENSTADPLTFME